MLKLEEEPPLQSAKDQALGPPPEEIWEPGHRVHLLVVIHILLVKPVVDIGTYMVSISFSEVFYIMK